MMQTLKEKELTRRLKQRLKVNPEVLSDDELTEWCADLHVCSYLPFPKEIQEAIRDCANQAYVGSFELSKDYKEIVLKGLE